VLRFQLHPDRSVIFRIDMARFSPGLVPARHGHRLRTIATRIGSASTVMSAPPRTKSLPFSEIGDLT